MKEAELFTSTIAPESPGKCASTKRLAGPAPAPGLAGVLQAPQVQAPSPLTTLPPVPGTRPGNCRWRGRVGVCYLGWVSSLQPPCLPRPQLCLSGWGCGGSPGVTACNHHPREGVGVSGELSSAHADGFPPTTTRLCLQCPRMALEGSRSPLLDTTPLHSPCRVQGLSLAARS